MRSGSAREAMASSIPARSVTSVRSMTIRSNRLRPTRIRSTIGRAAASSRVTDEDLADGRGLLVDQLGDAARPPADVAGPTDLGAMRAADRDVIHARRGDLVVARTGGAMDERDPPAVLGGVGDREARGDEDAERPDEPVGRRLAEDGDPVTFGGRSGQTGEVVDVIERGAAGRVVFAGQDHRPDAGPDQPTDGLRDPLDRGQRGHARVEQVAGHQEEVDLVHDGQLRSPARRRRTGARAGRRPARPGGDAGRRDGRPRSGGSGPSPGCSSWMGSCRSARRTELASEEPPGYLAR